MPISAAVSSWFSGASRSLTLAALWRITRRDGEVLRFTDHDQTIEFEGGTFTPFQGIDASARQRQVDLEHSNLDVVGILSDDSISDEELAGGLWRDAEIEEILVNWQLPWSGYVRKDVYTVTEIKRTAGRTWEAKIQGLTRKLESRAGITYARNCRHVLGDAFCGVDLGPFTESGVVESVNGSGFRLFSASGDFETAHTTDDTFFNDGVLVWKTGDNAITNMDSYEIKRIFDPPGSLEPSIELQQDTPFPIKVGDTFDVIAGCNKTTEHCKTKFSNIIRHGGFPFIPGNDKMLQSPRV